MTGMAMATLHWLLWAEMRVCDHKGNGYKIFFYILQNKVGSLCFSTHSLKQLRWLLIKMGMSYFGI